MNRRSRPVPASSASQDKTAGSRRRRSSPRIRTWRPEDEPRHRWLPGPTEEAAILELGLDPYVLQEQMSRAGCSHLERSAVMLWLVHRSLAAVSKKLGLPIAKIRLMLRAASDKLQRWRARHPEGLEREQILSVYAEDVNRFGYEDEHHCRPGEEECRRTGVCTRRWYLFYECRL